MWEKDLRIVKTLSIIDDSFLTCLDEIGFKDMMVKDITERAGINRSTFYKHYSDKYDLMTKYIDKVIKSFADNLETDFINLEKINMQTYYKNLKICLNAFLRRKRQFYVLWNADIPGRNVFEEMINAGVEKLSIQIKENKDILDDKKRKFTTLYARLFLGNMMVSVRWWFSEGEDIPVDLFTEIMIHHMSEGIFPTLKNPRIPTGA